MVRRPEVEYRPDLEEEANDLADTAQTGHHCAPAPVILTFLKVLGRYRSDCGGSALCQVRRSVFRRFAGIVLRTQPLQTEKARQLANLTVKVGGRKQFFLSPVVSLNTVGAFEVKLWPRRLFLRHLGSAF